MFPVSVCQIIIRGARAAEDAHFLVCGAPARQVRVNRKLKRLCDRPSSRPPAKGDFILRVTILAKRRRAE